MGRVLVTGAAGYIGSVLVRQLLEAGHEVIGLDRLLFGDHGIRGVGSPRFSFVHGDVRHPGDYEPLLARADAVVHLAAIVGDPACRQQPELAVETNLDAAWRVFEAAAASPSVGRFIFVSTCSNYGRHETAEYCTEKSPLSPLSLYAETKVEVEQRILAAGTEGAIVPTCLRFATAYGLSPRMRFDLTVNDFAREVFLGHRLEIYGEQFWRPYCHTTDLARACVMVLGSDPALVDHAVFNVGSTAENYTKSDLAAMLLTHRSHAEIVKVFKAEDPRDYKVNCDHIREVLGFVPQRTVVAGLADIFAALDDGQFGALAEAAMRNSLAA